MKRFAHHLLATLAATAALLGLTSTAAFAHPAPPEGCGGLYQLPPVEPVSITTAASPVPWMLTGAGLALAVVVLYVATTAIVHRQHGSTRRLSTP